MLISTGEFMSQTQDNKKLYVGSLPYATTEEELNAHFSASGEVVSVRIIVDKFTGQSKGFAFVEMGTADGARQAVSDLNGKPFQGRTLIVNLARPEQKRERSFGGGGGGGGGGGERKGRWNNSEGGSFRSQRYNNSY
jgi:cold-inducible RNA-binding protein